jgi:DNA invertase Pin-like site-specific DNA recombinase
MMMTVAIYCRVAQADDSAIEKQIQEAMHFAKTHGYSYISEYADNGASGLDFSRPAFLRLNEDIVSGKIGMVIVRTPDRIGRNIFETMRWVDWLRQRGVAVESMDGSLNNDSVMQIIEQIARSHKRGGGGNGAKKQKES